MSKAKQNKTTRAINIEIQFKKLNISRRKFRWMKFCCPKKGFSYLYNLINGFQITYDRNKILFKRENVFPTDD